jgi:hypothetical protein
MTDECSCELCITVSDDSGQNAEDIFKRVVKLCVLDSTHIICDDTFFVRMEYNIEKYDEFLTCKIDFIMLDEKKHDSHHISIVFSGGSIEAFEEFKTEIYAHLDNQSQN